MSVKIYQLALLAKKKGQINHLILLINENHFPIWKLMFKFAPINDKYILMVIAIDFDGTIVEHRYPSIGRELPFAIETLKKLTEEGHRLILWTVREGRLLDEAVAFCRERGLEFYAVNRDYPEEEKNRNNHFSRKLKADLWIDDRNLGGLPDWGTIYEMVHNRLTYEDLMHRYESAVSDTSTAKKGFFQRLFK